MRKTLRNAGILGVGIYMPENIITNDYWDDKEFLNRPAKKSFEDCFIGIKERRYFSLDMCPSDAEVEAGKRALEMSGVDPNEIDLVLTHAMVPDETIPGNASIIQHKLGLKNAAAWNMDTCCSSFVTMLITASNLIACGTYNKILITTSIFHSKIIDENDYLSPCAGDGSSAVVIGEVSEDRGYIASHATSDGYYHDAFTVRERFPLAHSSKKHSNITSPIRNLMTTNPVKVKEMGRMSIEQMTPVMLKTLEKAELRPEDINFFLSHQPAPWAHDAWRDSIGIPKEKSYHTFSIYGNLASTSIPTNLYHALDKGLIKDGDYILIASPGAGENHTSAVLKWGK
ncbi:3-oxoacyl-ACP synthase III family protein [Alkaliphilus hydrothermalis]|uniref:3-oxoacyl-[acyl-carrier-protein] synthase-3 n=1 Tax=Alkaliphilus hydrothermalis TaxID=1482730 RepID=A0ABS2NT92_9FIRM|nr:ketoacyl-ACP synthase III [Alkaliphilus hydrothermalis]MBM7616153.1 3-oxoacyl-[acyl-carrier-protein] synthase-3 [Alkaliphilus hydrothermalis]